MAERALLAGYPRIVFYTYIRLALEASGDQGQVKMPNNLLKAFPNALPFMKIIF